MSLDINFADFLLDKTTWHKMSSQHPERGLTNDPEGTENRRTAQQKVKHLELMLGQIANFAPVISRNSIIKASTSLRSVWQSLRQHYGFQSNGAHFLDICDIKLEPNEKPADLYQRLLSFVEDNLLQVTGEITHHGVKPTQDEELTPSMENFIEVTWLRLLHPMLPRLVKQRYGTELRARTLASIHEEVFQALPSLLDELQAAEDTRVLRSAARERPVQRPKPNNHTFQSRSLPKRSCPLCKEAGRPDNHFLSKCLFLPQSDKLYLSKARHILGDQEESEHEDSCTEEDTCCTHKQQCGTVTLRRVNTKSSPHFSAFFKQHPLRITLDTGAETNMIRSSVAHYVGANIKKSNQIALQADGITPLDVQGETCLTLSRDGRDFVLEALVVAELDVDILAGMPFMAVNDVAVRPAKSQIVVCGTDIIEYGRNRKSHSSGHQSHRT